MFREGEGQPIFTEVGVDEGGYVCVAGPVAYSYAH
jgi:hypothetical protein